MRSISASGLSRVAAMAVLVGIPARAGAPAPADLLGRMPVAFEPGVGQLGPEHPEVAFVARGAGIDAFLLPRAALLARPGAATAVTLSFRGAGGLAPRGEDPLPGTVSYLRGDAASTRTGIPRFAAVRVPEIYPDIDLVYHTRGGQLEFDLEIGPGAPPHAVAAVEMEVWGARGLCLDASGDLLIGTDAGDLVQRRPVVRQIVAGRASPLPARYELRDGGRVGLLLDAAEPGAAIVIDPVLEYSTYLGGGRNDAAHAVAVDGNGNAYVTGWTSSLSFPLKDPLQGTCGSCGPSSTDAFVAKLTPDGAALVFATYLGGSQKDVGNGIAVDRDGNVLVAGVTESPDFPVASAVQPQHGGGIDAFVTRLSPAGDAIYYSTFLGGGGDDRANAVAVSYSKAAHVVGSTTSPDFPIVAAVQPSPGGATDAFVAKLSEDGLFDFSTFVGDGGFDEARDVAVDAARNIFVAGDLGSDDLVCLEPRGRAFTYRVAMPGSATGRAVAVDGWSNAALAGTSHACSFEATDAVLMRVSPAGIPLTFTEITHCGDGPTEVHDAAVDVYGNTYVAGATQATDLQSCAWETYYPGEYWDAFVASVDTAGRLLPLATPLGGADFDAAFGIAADTWGTVWIAGETRSADFPTYLPLQPGLANDEGTRDGFVVRMVGAYPGDAPYPDFSAVNRSGPPPLVVTFADASSCAVDSWSWDFGDGSTSTLRSPQHTYAAEGIYTVSLTVGNGAGARTVVRPAYVTAGLPILTRFTASPTDGVLPMQVTFQNLTQGNVSAYVWDFGDGATSTEVAPVHTYTSLGTFDVTLTAIGPFARNTEYGTDVVTTHEVLPNFDATPRIVRPGQPVHFVNTTRGAALGFVWSFGDGSTSTELDPVHAYTSTGYPNVTLKATGPTTAETLTQPGFLLVSDFPAVQIVTSPGPDPSAPSRVDMLSVLGQPHTGAALLAYGGVGYGANVGTGAIDAGPEDRILTGPGPGPSLGPQVRAFRSDGSVISKVSFYAYGTLRYGVEPVGAELDGDVAAEIVTGAAPAPIFGPHVRGFNFDGVRLTALPRVSFYAYGTLRYGVHPAPGDVEADGREEVLTGPGPGVVFGPQVRAFRLASSVESVDTVNFFAFPTGTHGARAAASALEGGATEQILAGLGAGPMVVTGIRAFDHDGAKVTAIPEVDLEAFPGGLYGVEVRGGDLDGDHAGEILAARGPDPSAGGDLRGFDYAQEPIEIPSTMVTAIPSLSFAPYASRYGIHAALGALEP